jgi:hypothetical protein
MLINIINVININKLNYIFLLSPSAQHHTTPPAPAKKTSEEFVAYSEFAQPANQM